VIEIPSKRNAFVLAFLPIWLVGWAFGWVSAAHQVATGRGGSDATLFLLVWLTFWTAGGAFEVLALCWQIAGRQLITLAASEITVAHQLFGVRREQRYSLGHATNLRVSAEGYNPFDFRSGLRFWGYGGGPIAFDYGASTIRLGSSVEESEALALVRRLVERQPSFAKKSAT
jgi:hypothetical protein